MTVKAQMQLAAGKIQYRNVRASQSTERTMGAEADSPYRPGESRPPISTLHLPLKLARGCVPESQRGVEPAGDDA